MAKRKLYWHVGPASVDTAFLAPALAALDTDEANTVSVAAAIDADLDLRRAHRAAGRRRDMVDGAWSRIESTVWKHKGRWLLSTPTMGLADPDQIRMARDGLRGVEVHVVVIRTDPAYDAQPILDAWAQPLHPERVHLVESAPDAESVWGSFLAVAGLELPMPAVATIEVGTPEWGLLRQVGALLDPTRPELPGIVTELITAPRAGGRTESSAAALAAATVEIATLRADTERLTSEVSRLDRKRRKHKRRVAELQELTNEHPDFTPVA
jgi:hypothetical protein